MKAPFFASFIVFCIWLSYELHKVRKLEKKQEENFWEKERVANLTRKKNLQDLNYVSLPSWLLSMDFSEASSVRDTLLSLSDKSIVNFNGISNTELKLMYGASNLTALSEYDSNFSLLIKTLQEAAVFLVSCHRYEDAKQVLEFALSIHSDISASFYLLADLYQELHILDKNEELALTAEALNTPMGTVIARTLRKSGPYSDLLRSE